MSSFPILIVEDKDSLRAMLRHALEGHGHAVLEARDETEAVQQLGQSRPVVVLTDLKLPVGDGFGVLRAAKELDPDLPVETVRTIEQIIEVSTGQSRFGTFILAAFAALALMLAAVGIYGLVSFSVSQRTSEMGVRLALGARPGQIGVLVLRQGLALAVAGVCIGLGVAALGGRVLAALLYETSATEPAIYGGLALLLLTIAAVACYVPARRAMRVDPMRALRAD